MKNRKILKYGELFCGPGGMAYGAILATKDNPYFDIKLLWANDIDSDSCSTYRENICSYHVGSEVINKSVENLDFENLDYVDILTFGFPCNDFSLVGEQKGINGKYGPLYLYGEKALRSQYRPQIFVAENVSGITSSNSKEAFKIIVDKYRNAGYLLTVHKYKFEDYGVPQNRHRVIIVGLDQEKFNDYFRVPVPKYINKSAKEALEVPSIPTDALNNEPTKQSAIVAERLSYIKPGQNAWNADIPVHLQLKVKNAKLSQIYKRLLPNKPAYTVTGSGGGGTHIYHYDMKQCRSLTNRERARLQTFPDDFYFHGTKESVRRQIGMAVPPDGIKHIFKAILNTLSDSIYTFVHPNIGYFKPD